MALYDGVDMAQVMYGQNARHVPAFLYVQNQGDGVVSFVGGSALPAGSVHPLRYGSDRIHQLIIGEVVVRPHVVVATDTLGGHGLDGLILGHHNLGQMLARGEMLIGTEGQARAAGNGWL